MIQSLPSDIKDQIKNLTLEARSKRIIRVLHDYLKQHYNHFLAIHPDPDQPWKTSFAFWISNQTVFHYLYMWYLLNQYYLLIHFEPRFYKLLFPNNNKYFENLWSEILKNDAHNGDWKQYTTAVHPRFGHKIAARAMIGNNIPPQFI